MESDFQGSLTCEVEKDSYLALIFPANVLHKLWLHQSLVCTSFLRATGRKFMLGSILWQHIKSIQHTLYGATDIQIFRLHLFGGIKNLYSINSRAIVHVALLIILESWNFVGCNIFGHISTTTGCCCNGIMNDHSTGTSIFL